jgi:hypothetical protein
MIFDKPKVLKKRDKIEQFLVKHKVEDNLYKNFIGEISWIGMKFKTFHRT